MRTRLAGMLSVLLVGCTGVIGDGAGEEEKPAGGSAPTPLARTDKGVRLPRLGHLQWARTAQAFLKLPATPTVVLRGDVAPPDAYETDVRARVVDDALVRDYRTAADTLADHLVDNAMEYARFVADGGAGDVETRLRALLATAWPRAYRRALTSEEIAAYVSLAATAPGYGVAADDEERLRLALRALLRITLQSPHFVYRVELGDPATEREDEGRRWRTLTAPEYRARVSYALVNAPPTSLGGLVETDEAMVARLLDDPRAADTLLEFHKALYGVDASRSMRKDTARFPGTEGLGVDAATEAERFLADTVASDGGLRQLLLSRKTFVNRRLASIYGLSTDGLADDTYVARELPAERAGILTRVSWTGAEADLFERSSILRGVYVVKKLFCTPIGPPPAGAESEAAKPPATLLTNRERVAFKTSPDKCKGCHHSIINPAGFAFEAFDAIGRFVTADNGAPVDASGALFIDGVNREFKDARSFLEAAAEAEQAHACYTHNLATYFLGRPSDDRTLTERSRAGASTRALLAALLLSQSFRAVVVEES